jgi:hypothetical protein
MSTGQSLLPPGYGKRIPLLPLTTETIVGGRTVAPLLAAGQALTPAVPAAGIVGGLWRFDYAAFLLTVANSATEAGDTLDVFIDVCLNGVGQAAADWVNAIHFLQVLGTAGAVLATPATWKRHWSALDIRAGFGAATPVDVSADLAAGTVRATLWGDLMRVRYATVDAVTTGNMNFAFKLDMWVQ